MFIVSKAFEIEAGIVNEHRPGGRTSPPPSGRRPACGHDKVLTPVNQETPNMIPVTPMPVRFHRAPDPVPIEEPQPEPFDAPHPHHTPIHTPQTEDPVPDPKPSVH
jgi:hypothetical protein